MFRRPLRTRAGCDRCKSRRKKCDEAKPTCENCLRLNLSCTWTRVHVEGAGGSIGAGTGAGPGAGTVSVAGASGDMVPFGPDDRTWPKSVKIKRVPRSVRDGAAGIGSRHGFDDFGLGLGLGLGRGYQQFRDQAQFELTAWSPTAIQGFISRSAAPEFSDTSGLMPLALQHPWLRDALAAFSAYGRFNMTKGKQDWENVAMTSYQKALSAVRSQIRTSCDGAESLEMLVAVTFLGLSESLGAGDASRALTHFSVAAVICRTVSLASVRSPSGRRLYRIAVECWLYNLATLAVFHEDCTSLMLCVDWSVLDACFLASPAPNDWALHKSPFVGGNHGVYKLMLQVTCFARKSAPLLARQVRSAEWSLTLDDVEARLDNYYDSLPYDIATLYRSKFLIHVYALRIFSAKVADHDLTASSPFVVNNVRAAQEIFLAQPIHENRNPALAWPLIILLCAVDDDTTFNFFTNTIDSIHDNFDTGHARRMKAVLKIVRRRRADNRSVLDLLLCKRGILAPNS